MAFRRSGSLKGENEAAASRGQSFSPVGQHKPAIEARVFILRVIPDEFRTSAGAARPLMDLRGMKER